MKKFKKEVVKEVIKLKILEPLTQEWIEIVYTSRLTRRLNKGKSFKEIVGGK